MVGMTFIWPSMLAGMPLPWLLVSILGVLITAILIFTLVVGHNINKFYDEFFSNFTFAACKASQILLFISVIFLAIAPIGYLTFCLAQSMMTTVSEAFWTYIVAFCHSVWYYVTFILGGAFWSNIYKNVPTINLLAMSLYIYGGLALLITWFVLHAKGKLVVEE